MSSDPAAQDINDEYVRAFAEAFRLGRREPTFRPPEASEHPALVERLQHPVPRTLSNMDR